MKKIQFLVAALAALSMFSCSNEEVTGEAPQVNAKAKVTISLQGKGETRATDDATPHTNDTEINNYIAFFFTNEGALVSKHYVSDPTQNDANSLTTITTAKKVCIIANTGALEGGLFANVTTENQLKAVSGSLAKETLTPFSTATQTGTNVWSTGTSTVTFNMDTKQGEATVNMHFLAAKIMVTVDDRRMNNDDPSKIQIINKDIVLLNAGGEAHFFAADADKMVQTKWFNGDVSYANPTNTVEGTFLSETYAANGIYFYAFGNSSEDQPTILAIKAERVENNNEATTVYYPIAFSAADAGADTSEYADFVPGNAYDVTLTLTGDVAAGDGGGTIDPEEPLVEAGVAVTISKATWNIKPVGKTFN